MPRAPRKDVTRLLTDVPIFTRQRGGRFIVMQGPDRGETVPAKDLVTFGSAPSCSLVLTDNTVSRKHLEARWQEGGVILKDLGSTNGSFFEGSRIHEITINFGAEFKLGRTVVKLVPEEEVVEPSVSDSENYGTIVGQDPKMRRLFSLLNDIATTDATVVVEGETGTGKELVAEELHKNSNRRDGPFIVFDCGAVPRDLIKSALFGHLKGSFTGAVCDRKGAFGEAHGGTIFLDEIGELDLELQPSLLRVLDKRAVQRVGANQYENVDVRIVAATNRDLREEVANKNFREDLYYRLAVICINLPPLRERGLDIPYLVEHFIRMYSPPGRHLNAQPDDMARLQRHSWPGNVRELRNVIERACVLSSGDSINIDDALAEEAPPALGIRTDLPFKEAKGQLVELFELEYIVDLMRRHKMNISAAAREAQIDRKHLRELIRKYEIDER
ncbi:MAG: sigma 54-dependent Fis family transcriptional regulator [Deltaproteobacteria bacterium]|nr:sigma 54-dependent Fis family transcriptional regulator [Deltaproteobacteria bacterium]